MFLEHIEKILQDRFLLFGLIAELWPVHGAYSDSKNCSNVSNLWKKSLITPSGRYLKIFGRIGKYLSYNIALSCKT